MTTSIRLRLAAVITAASAVFLILSSGVDLFSADAGGMTISGTVTVISKNNKPIRDRSGIVVYLEEVSGNRGFPVSPVPTVVASRDMVFDPPVVVVEAGTAVRFTNADDIVHNVYSLSMIKPFDLGLMEHGDAASVTFSAPGVARIYCNIHKKMIGYILVVGNPFFCLAAADGKYSIKGVPPGTYTITVWYRYGETVRKQVTIAGNPSPGSGVSSAQGIDFVVTRSRGDPQHLNKWGKEYDEKY